jgi:penicillin-binding protein-related factor A (putative recombinase)
MEVEYGRQQANANITTVTLPSHQYQHISQIHEVPTIAWLIVFLYYQPHTHMFGIDHRMSKFSKLRIAYKVNTY